MNTLLIAILILSIFGFLFGLILGYAAWKFKVIEDPISEKIDDILPQSQCGQCGYLGCRPYANAISKGEAINKCIPGSTQVMLKLATLLNITPQPLNNKISSNMESHIAYINEINCIGCTKCIHICPVDAIVGAPKKMHTVISDLCTGCDLCIKICPTNCIKIKQMKNIHTNWNLDKNIIPVEFINTEKYV
ncbi:Electron transport complex subunit RsxB [Serratia symbiotica]|nr:Electron transport complex subunit RsxB [Serratia symbiotica]